MGLSAGARHHTLKMATASAPLARGLTRVSGRTGGARRASSISLSQVVRFAFLAPTIVERIGDGSQPPEFTAESLVRRRSELPLSWAAQRKLLGFPESRQG